MSEKKGWLKKKGSEKAKSSGLFGGHGTRQEQLEAMEMELQPSPLKQEKKRK
jgi:hypothetical protein